MEIRWNNHRLPSPTQKGNLGSLSVDYMSGVPHAHCGLNKLEDQRMESVDIYLGDRKQQFFTTLIR